MDKVSLSKSRSAASVQLMVEPSPPPGQISPPTQPKVAPSTRFPVNTRFLLFLAVLLVVNSHLEDFYPRAFLAGDGLIGYALFFFVSGLGIALSYRRGVRPFREYYYRRIVRIYPTVWLAVVPEAVLTGAIFTFSISDYVAAFMWPTHNTFVGPIMVDYGLLYFALRSRSSRFVLGLICALAVPFALIWFTTGHLGTAIYRDPIGAWLPRIANFEAMLIGAYFGLRSSDSLATFRRDLWLFVATLTSYIAFRYSLLGGWHKELFPLLYLLVFAMLVWLVRIASSRQLKALMQDFPRAATFIDLLGLCCLEAYFVHQFVIVYLPAVARIRFPLNLAVLWAIVIPGSYLLERLATWARSGFRTFTWRIDESAA